MASHLLEGDFIMKYINAFGAFFLTFAVTSYLFLNQIPYLQHVLPILTVLSIIVRIITLSLNADNFELTMAGYKKKIAIYSPDVYMAINHLMVAGYTLVMIYGNYYTLACLYALTYMAFTFKINNHFESIGK
jgi:hypothetical protein